MTNKSEQMMYPTNNDPDIWRCIDATVSPLSFAINYIVVTFFVIFGVGGSYYLRRKLGRVEDRSSRLVRYVRALCVWDALLLLSTFGFYGLVGLLYGDGILTGYVSTLSFIVFFPATHITMTGAVLLSVVITTERYLAVSQPIKHHMRRVNSLTWINLSIVLIAIVLNGPTFFELRMGFCRQPDTGKVVATIGTTGIRENLLFVFYYRFFIYGMTTSVLPFLLVLVLSVLTLRGLYKHSAKRSNHLEQNGVAPHRRRRFHLEQNKVTTVLMCCLVVKFLCCYSMPTLVTVIEVFYGNQHIPNGIVDASNFLVVLHSTTNWPIFLLWRHLTQRPKPTRQPNYARLRFTEEDASLLRRLWPGGADAERLGVEVLTAVLASNARLQRVFGVYASAVRRREEREAEEETEREDAERAGYGSSRHGRHVAQLAMLMRPRLWTVASGPYNGDPARRHDLPPVRSKRSTTAPIEHVLCHAVASTPSVTTLQRHAKAVTSLQNDDRQRFGGSSDSSPAAVTFQMEDDDGHIKGSAVSYTVAEVKVQNEEGRHGRGGVLPPKDGLANSSSAVVEFHTDESSDFQALADTTTLLGLERQENASHYVKDMGDAVVGVETSQTNGSCHIKGNIDKTLATADSVLATEVQQNGGCNIKGSADMSPQAAVAALQTANFKESTASSSTAEFGIQMCDGPFKGPTEPSLVAVAPQTDYSLCFNGITDSENATADDRDPPTTHDDGDTLLFDELVADFGGRLGRFLDSAVRALTSANDEQGNEAIRQLSTSARQLGESASAGGIPLRNVDWCLMRELVVRRLTAATTGPNTTAERRTSGAKTTTTTIAGVSVGDEPQGGCSSGQTTATTRAGVSVGDERQKGHATTRAGGGVRELKGREPPAAVVGDDSEETVRVVNKFVKLIIRQVKIGMVTGRNPPGPLNPNSVVSDVSTTDRSSAIYVNDIY